MDPCLSSAAVEIDWSAAHRPYSPPKGRPWVFSMGWIDLLFMHWPIAPETLRPIVPAALQLDAFDGDAWISVVPFRMSGPRPRGLPIPDIEGLTAFPELNVRTYVTVQGKPGLYFFSLDAASAAAVAGARVSFHLPYYHADMRCDAQADGVRYSSTRTHRGAARAEFRARYAPIGEPFTTRPGELDHFLTARFCLYSVDAQGGVHRGEVHHGPWPLQPAECEVRANTVVDALGIRQPDVPPRLQFARRIEVAGWLPERVEA